jgi:hypothetical protein
MQVAPGASAVDSSKSGLVRLVSFVSLDAMAPNGCRAGEMRTDERKECDPIITRKIKLAHKIYSKYIRIDVEWEQKKRGGTICYPPTTQVRAPPDTMMPYKCKICTARNFAQTHVCSGILPPDSNSGGGARGSLRTRRVSERGCADRGAGGTCREGGVQYDCGCAKLYVGRRWCALHRERKAQRLAQMQAVLC